MKTKSYLCLDVGEKRIGVAVADGGVRIAVPLLTIEVDGKEIEQIVRLSLIEKVDAIIVGYPRNQKGETTAQTAFVERFAARLEHLDADIIFQDESLTSVLAEKRLESYRKPYTKADIDAQAATIILQDYLETH